MHVSSSSISVQCFLEETYQGKQILKTFENLFQVTIYQALDDTRQRLQNFYVLSSPGPFVSDRLQEVLYREHSL